MPNLKRCEIVSNLKDKDGNILFDLDNMRLILETKKCIKHYSYIIHDKDCYTSQDEAKNPEHKAGEPKTPHVHLLLRFHDNQPQNSCYICKWFGLSENFVNRICGKWEDAVAYQTHRNAPDKYQYSPEEEVHCNFDYIAVCEQRDNAKNPLKEAIEKILSGEIREYNKTIEIDNLLLVQYARQINEAFKVRSEHLQATMQERQMQCIFITGSAGSGKTTLAKKIATNGQKNYYLSSGSNDILDGYAQQPVIILDDLRPSSLGLSDLLKLLDNWNTCSVKSRYKNKYVNCELVIITTVLNIETFYENVFSEQKEPINQLKRRCGIYIRMDKEVINISVWDNTTMRYTNEVTYENDLLSEYLSDNKKTTADVKNQVSDLMPFLKVEEDTVFHLTPIDKERKNGTK